MENDYPNPEPTGQFFADDGSDIYPNEDVLCTQAQYIEPELDSPNPIGGVHVIFNKSNHTISDEEQEIIIELCSKAKAGIVVRENNKLTKGTHIHAALVMPNWANNMVGRWRKKVGWTNKDSVKSHKNWSADKEWAMVACGYVVKEGTILKKWGIPDDYYKLYNDKYENTRFMSFFTGKNRRVNQNNYLMLLCAFAIKHKLTNFDEAERAFCENSPNLLFHRCVRFPPGTRQLMKYDFHKVVNGKNYVDYRLLYDSNDFR